MRMTVQSSTLTRYWNKWSWSCKKANVPHFCCMWATMVSQQDWTTIQNPELPNAICPNVTKFLFWFGFQKSIKGNFLKYLRMGERIFTHHCRGIMPFGVWSTWHGSNFQNRWRKAVCFPGNTFCLNVELCIIRSINQQLCLEKSETFNSSSSSPQSHFFRVTEQGGAPGSVRYFAHISFWLIIKIVPLSFNTSVS